MGESWRRGEGRKGRKGTTGCPWTGPLETKNPAWRTIRGVKETRLLAIQGRRLVPIRASKGSRQCKGLGSPRREGWASRLDPFDYSAKLPEGILPSKLRAKGNGRPVPIGDDRAPIATGPPKIQGNRGFNGRVFGSESMFGFHGFKGEHGQRFRREARRSRIDGSMGYAQAGNRSPPRSLP